MPWRDYLEGFTVKELVGLARDRFQLLGLFMHPEWTRLFPGMSSYTLREYRTIDGAALAEVLGFLAEALETRGRLIDAACCWGQVGSFFSKYSHYKGPSTAPEEDPRDDEGDDAIAAIYRWWRFTDHSRAITPFGRAGLAFFRAYEELGEEAEQAFWRRRKNNVDQSALLAFIELAMEGMGRPLADNTLPECFYRLQPLWCARGVLHCLDQPGVPPVEGAALALFEELDRRWEEWLSLFFELETFDVSVHTLSWARGGEDRGLDHDRRRLTAALETARRAPA